MLYLSSCKENIVAPNEEIQIQATTQALTSDIEETKKWFEEQKATSSSLVKSKINFSKMVPAWDKAKTNNGRGKEITEVPFTIDNNFLYPTLSSSVAKKGIQRLIIKGNGANRKSFVVNIVPAVHYSGNMANLDFGNYYENKFSGFIAIFAMDGTSLDCYSIYNGYAIRKLKLNEGLVTRTCEYTLNIFACGSVLDGPLQCSYSVGTDCYSIPSTNPFLEPLDPYQNPWDVINNTGGSNSGNNNNNNSGFSPPPPPPYVCASNFSFTSLNPQVSIEQQAGISGVKETIVNNTTQQTIEISLPTLYFKNAFHDVNGNTVVSPSSAAKEAADAINYALNSVRTAYNNGTKTAKEDLEAMWLSSLEVFYKGIPANMDNPYYDIKAINTHSLIYGHTPLVKVFVNCN